MLFLELSYIDSSADVSSVTSHLAGFALTKGISVALGWAVP